MEINQSRIPPSSDDFKPIKSSPPSSLIKSSAPALPVNTDTAGNLYIGSYFASKLFTQIATVFNFGNSNCVDFSKFDANTLQKIANVFYCVASAAYTSVCNDIDNGLSASHQKREFEWCCAEYHNWPPLEFINLACIPNFANFGAGLKNQMGKPNESMPPTNIQYGAYMSLLTCLLPTDQYTPTSDVNAYQLLLNAFSFIPNQIISDGTSYISLEPKIPLYPYENSVYSYIQALLSELNAPQPNDAAIVSCAAYASKKCIDI